MKKPFLSFDQRRAQASAEGIRTLTFHRPLLEVSQRLGISKKSLLERMYAEENKSGAMDGLVNIVSAQDLDSHFTLEMFGSGDSLFAYLVPNDSEANISYYFDIDFQTGEVTRVGRESTVKKTRESTEYLMGGWTVDLS